MEMLLQISLATTSVFVVGLMLRRTSRKSFERSIEAGAVSTGWLAEYRIRRRDSGGIE
jgi:hypothetical protein